MHDSSKTVLIVEDEDAIRNLLYSVLSRRYKAFQAADAEEAISRVSGHMRQIDLLVTDVLMPGMDGFALAHHIRAHNPELRILFISGYFSTEEFRSRVAEFGATYLRKPFSIPSLVTIVNSILAA